MKKFNFLLCYDIANTKRLRKVAKLLESQSIRIQYSLYYCMDISATELKILIGKLEKLIDQEQDDIRIYKVHKSKSLHLKSAINLKKPTILGV